jgi:hypothetical protein
MTLLLQVPAPGLRRSRRYCVGGGARLVDALLIREVCLVHPRELLAQGHVECNQVVEGVDKLYFVSGGIECGTLAAALLSFSQRSTWLLTLCVSMCGIKSHTAEAGVVL